MDKLPKVDRSASFVNKELINLNMFGKNNTSSAAVDFRYSSNTTEYFYQEDAPGQTYDNLGFFVNEILISLAATGSGILRLSEAQLTNVASGDPTYVQMITDLLNSQLDNSDIHKPHAYLVWMLYDNQMVLDPASSGVAKVENPNELAVLIREHIDVSKDGYLHAYVSNGSTVGVSFDNFNVTRVKGKIRQINDYYPYGMAIAGLNGDYNEYPIKYTSKELQAGEFPTSMSHGLEMFDFGSRFYDAQLGRWHTPDPAEQFANPYLAIGNNPVMYVDPDGEWIQAVIGAAIGVITNGISNATNGQEFFQNAGKAALIGAVGGLVSAGIGNAAASFSGFGKVAFQTVAHSQAGAFMSGYSGQNPGVGMISGGLGSLAATGSTALLGNVSNKLVQGAGVLATGTLVGGASSAFAGGNFWDGARNGAISAGLNHAMHFAQKIFQDPPRIVFDGKNISVIDADGNLLARFPATSGKGEHMNNPFSQAEQDLGPIPAGEYSFKGDEWNSQSPLRQLYNIIKGQGDWGDYNVKLQPNADHGPPGPRHSFYLHGGKYPGSAGCIDVGSYIKHIRNLTYEYPRIQIRVNYGNY